MRNFNVGDYVITPSGKKAKVLKVSVGKTDKRYDPFDRIHLQYVGVKVGTEYGKDKVTLQPSLLKYES